MPTPSDPAELERLKAKVRALRAKTTENGCTEAEALAAAAKVAALVDRHDLSLADIEIARTQCERIAFEPGRRKRVPLDGCIEAIARFCDCSVWREKSAEGEIRWVFFGLPVDVVAAHALAEVVDSAVRTELGRYKTSTDYARFRHNERHLANASFVLGMVDSIGDALIAMKEERDGARRGSGRDLAVVKSSLVEQELAQLDFGLTTVSSGRGRLVSTDAYEAGNAAGTSLPSGIAGAVPQARSGRRG